MREYCMKASGSNIISQLQVIATTRIALVPQNLSKGQPILPIGKKYCVTLCRVQFEYPPLNT